MYKFSCNPTGVTSTNIIEKYDRAGSIGCRNSPRALQDLLWKQRKKAGKDEALKGIRCGVVQWCCSKSCRKMVRKIEEG